MRTLVIGTGVTGRAVAAFLNARGIPFDSFDDVNQQKPDGFDAALQHMHTPECVDPKRYDRAVVSPGMPREHPVTLRMMQAGVPVLAEIELAFQHAKGPVVAVTGSNGKSTTASMIHHLLAGSGRRSSLCGNIGLPFISCVDDDPNHCYVVEVSSFQLEHVVAFNPKVGILLNISPDHLDWHGGFEGYEAAKLRLFACQTEDDLALIPPAFAKRIPGKGTRVMIPGPDVQLRRDDLVVLPDFRLPLSALPLSGPHNQTNAMFACCAAHMLGISDHMAEDVLPDFQGLEHRMERVGVYQDRVWINDTKATNVQASQAAVDAMTGGYVLILGGCDKGEDFNELNLSTNPPRALVTYGETAPKLNEALASFNPQTEHHFRDACLAAHHLALPGDIVLLSPACASFDQFDNFAQRGKVFKRIFEELTSV